MSVPRRPTSYAASLLERPGQIDVAPETDRARAPGCGCETVVWVTAEFSGLPVDLPTELAIPSGFRRHNFPRCHWPAMNRYSLARHYHLPLRSPLITVLISRNSRHSLRIERGGVRRGCCGDLPQDAALTSHAGILQSQPGKQSTRRNIDHWFTAGDRGRQNSSGCNFGRG